MGILKSIYKNFSKYWNSTEIPEIPEIPELPELSELSKDSTSLAPYPLEYSECKPFMPLHDGDRVYCTKVYDGDTVTVCWIDSHGEKVRIGCRIDGIDTPEIRGSSAEEKELALRAKDRLSKEVLNKYVVIRNQGIEKYGRVLADLETDTRVSIKEYMLEDPELCKPYTGGTKQKWD